MSDLSDALVERLNEALDDIQEVVDFHIEDVDSDPELIDVVIRGRLKPNLSRPQNKQKDPAQDYDRAMKGLSPYDIPDNSIRD